MGVVLLAATTFGVVATDSANASVDTGSDVPRDQVLTVDDSGGPALAFTSREFSFYPSAFLFCDHEFANCDGSVNSLQGPDWDDHNDDLVLGNRYFGRVSVQARDGDADGVKYAVEGVSGEPRQFCGRDCYDLLLGVREDSGLLYMFMDDYDNDRPFYYINGHPVRTVEFSAEDSASDLMVYREAVVGPSEHASECGDYPSANRDRFTCLFMHELPPSEQPETPSSLRDSLPNLVQPKENYSLIFAEEFNGTPIEDGCKEGLDNGMATLDSDLWNHDPNPCDSGDTDSRGEPCQNIRDGRYYMTRVHSCRGSMSTYGKFSFKYGYVEVKFSVNTNVNYFYQNYAFSAGNPVVALESLHDEYNVVVDSYEDIARASSMEINVFEHVPRSRKTVSHQYINGPRQQYDAPLVPTNSSRWNIYCGSGTSTQITLQHASCWNNGKITVTLGLEWTPAGYRSFQKIDGHNDDLTVRPKNKISVEYKPITITDADTGEFTIGRNKVAYTGSDRDKYFTYLDPDDTDSLLELVAIAHRPMELIVRASGFASSSYDTIRTRLELDYIRIFQPEDLYTSMEPVYQ
ncbi:hypothetical protein [Candidatus Poriferisodalis sp.]|uniref:hypothetical protein n=1 Tax=Candidatus Poriferisodalis sp. TaxID=3101277 RepID=UPI003AF45CDA